MRRPKGHGRLAQCRIALEGGNGLPAWKKYGGFSSRPQLRYFIVKWTSAYDIRFEPVAFSMASIKVLPENGFVR